MTEYIRVIQSKNGGPLEIRWVRHDTPIAGILRHNRSAVITGTTDTTEWWTLDEAIRLGIARIEFNEECRPSLR